MPSDLFRNTKLTRQRVPNEDRFLRQFASHDDYDDLILNSSTRVLKPDGTPLLVLVKGGLSMQAGGAMYRAIHDKIAWTNNRGTASGQVSRGDLKKDGTVSKTTRTEKAVQSSIMGFFDRNPRFPYCRKTAFAESYPAAYQKCLPALKEANDLFAYYLPKQYARQKEVADRTSPDFVIPNTVFTTVTLNRNFRTGYHRDAGDFKDGFGVLTYFRGGRFRGGALVFPAWRVAVQMDSLDVLLFDPHEIHGNTAIHPQQDGWERITCVHYYRENMHYCGSAEQELDLVKNHDPRMGSRNMRLNAMIQAEQEHNAALQEKAE